MRRREFVSCLAAGAAVAWPLAARAQQAGVPVIGFLHAGIADANKDYLAGFRQGLKEAGKVENQNVTIEFRWADGNYERLPALVADLIGRRVAVIFAGGGAPSILAAKSATLTTPIVFISGADPVTTGLVASLNRPGGNVTGMSLLSTMLVGKQLELLRELVPGVRVIAALVNPSSPTAEATEREALAAVRTLGLQLIVLRARTANDFDSVFSTAVRQGVGALVVGPDGLFISQRALLVEMAAQHAVPTIYEQREYSTVGGLISYGANISDQYRQAGIYVARILKGEKPADLPVQQPTKFELVVNLKTAKAIGLTIPETFLVRADEVIE